MQDLQVGEMKSAAEIKGTGGAFHSAVASIQVPSAAEEEQIKALFAGKTMDNLDDQVIVPAPTQEQPKQAAAPSQETKPAEVPQKFLKPDGTVDEEKLKASSEQLGKAVEQRRKSIDEMLAEYKKNEEQLRQSGAEANKLKEALRQEPVIQQPALQPGPVPQNMEQVRQQLLQLQQQDPIAFAVEIAKAVSRKEAADLLEPLREEVKPLSDQRQDLQKRTQLAALAEQDVRVMNPELYGELMQELNSDPAYFRLKNPIKSAWNEVKDRMRLGEPQSVQAQPSQTTSPTLGRGVTPAVSSLASNRPLTFETAQTINPTSSEGRQLEEALLKQMAESTWRA